MSADVWYTLYMVRSQAEHAAKIEAEQQEAQALRAKNQREFKAGVEKAMKDALSPEYRQRLKYFADILYPRGDCTGYDIPELEMMTRVYLRWSDLCARLEDAIDTKAEKQIDAMLSTTAKILDNCYKAFRMTPASRAPSHTATLKPLKKPSKKKTDPLAKYMAV